MARKESIFGIFSARVRALAPKLNAVNSLTRHALDGRLERVSFRDHAIVLVLGTLSDERRRLRHEP
jgi:hypothetical protein